MDGTHHLCNWFYHDKDFLPVEIHWFSPYYDGRRFSIDCFLSKGFTLGEVNLIRTKMDEIFQKAKTKTGDFNFLLFPFVL